MARPQEYIVNSLETHLFFARIMKEHAFFLQAGLLKPCEELKEEGHTLQCRFEELLLRTIQLSGGVVRRSVLESGEICTRFTECAEKQTRCLTGTELNLELTGRQMQLKGRNRNDQLNVSQNMLRQVRQLNRDSLQALGCLIEYKEKLLCLVKNGEIFTGNYPLLIEHILREARLYRAQIMRLEGINDGSYQEPKNNEPFWNRIMMEHALFIRGLLDPCEEELIETANSFAGEFKCLLEASAAANDKMMRSSKELTRQLRDFNCAGTEGITNCSIRSIILPLLADHVLREANHYLRLLEE